MHSGSWFSGSWFGGSWFGSAGSSGAVAVYGLSWEIYLSATPAASEVQFTSTWLDYTSTSISPDSYVGQSSGTTAATIIAPPQTQATRVPKLLNVYNADSARTRMFVQLNTGLGTWTVVDHWLDPGSVFELTDVEGSRIITNQGAEQVEGSIE